MEYVRRILVVDDEPEFIGSLERHLRREGFITESARDGREASHKISRARADKAPFDLVITDVLMPDMDGIQLYRWTKREFPDTSVILISAFGDSEEVLGSIQPELDDYGRKPLTPREMMDLIGSVERKRKCASVRMRKLMGDLKAAVPNARSVPGEF